MSRDIEVLANKIIEYNPTIICTQETNNNFYTRMNTKNYELKHTNGNTRTERIDFYLKNDSDITALPTFIPLSSTICNTPRTDIIITIQYTNIKIGIVHLCGGRTDENVFAGILASLTDINEKKKKIKQIKEEQIQKMIHQDVDIILGDFNSDIEHYLGNSNQKNMEYLEKKLLDHDIIDFYNKVPFDLLEKSGYNLLCGDKQNSLIFYIPHTSVYGTSPDAIYYKSTKLIVNDFKIIDLLTGELSDHNGIYADFSLITSSSTGGNYNKKSLKKK